MRMPEAIRNPAVPGEEHPLADPGDARVGSRPFVERLTLWVILNP